MRHEALWDRTSAETADDLGRAQRRGHGLVSLCSYLGPDGPLHATAWGPGPAQRFEPDVEVGLSAGVLSRHARDDFHPVLVGMCGPASRPLLAFVLERGQPGAPAPRFVPPRPFRDPDGTLFVAHAAGSGPRDAGFISSIAAAGVPPLAGETDWSSLLVAGVWAPQPPVRIAWAVHLDPASAADGAWRERWEPRTLETVARPVLAIPLSASTGERWVLSLWHDRMLAPWPEPDPFARGPRFAADEAPGAAALADAVAARREREDRRVVAIGAGAGPGATRFLALYGTPGTEAALERRFVMVAPGDTPPPAVAPGEPAEPAPEHPLDRWVLQRLGATGARHAQLVVVRGRRLTFARAYTLAEAGYPVATLDDAMRLGSVSKALTTVALLAALRRGGPGEGVTAPVADKGLLDLAPGEGPPRLAAVTLRHLLTHDAGLRTFVGVRPDEPENPLSEHRITELLSGVAGPARPGQLGDALRALHADDVFARAPGGSGATRFDYSNEGFVLLGEILSRLARGSGDAYEAAVEDALLRPAGVDPGGRGCLLGAGRRRARERRESPAHPSSPTWAAKRFPGDDLDEGPLSLVPYADNGPFLGGAAGWCVPLAWLARVLAALGPHRGGGLWQRGDAQIAATPAAPGARQGHGFHLGETGWWTFRPSLAPTRAAPAAPSANDGRRSPDTVRLLRLHHNGRLEGGTALLVHLMPHDAADDARDVTLSIAVAFNALGPLYEDPHGHELLALARRLEGTPGWDTEDLFPLLP